MDSTSVVGVLRFLNIFLAAITAGTLVAMLVALIPLVRSVPPGAGLALRRGFESRVERYSPACSLLSGIIAVSLLFLGPGLPGRVATALGIAASLTLAVSSLAGTHRIDRRMGPQAEGPLPPDYETLRARWERAHMVRTVAAMIALGCYVVAGRLD